MLVIEDPQRPALLSSVEKTTGEGWSLEQKIELGSTFGYTTIIVAFQSSTRNFEFDQSNNDLLDRCSNFEIRYELSQGFVETLAHFVRD